MRSYIPEVFPSLTEHCPEHVETHVCWFLHTTVLAHELGITATTTFFIIRTTLERAWTGKDTLELE